MAHLGLAFPGSSRKVSCYTCFWVRPRPFCSLRVSGPWLALAEGPDKAETRNGNLRVDGFCSAYRFSPWPSLIIAILQINSFWEWLIWPWRVSLSGNYSAISHTRMQKGGPLLFCFVLFYFVSFCFSFCTPKAVLFQFFSTNHPLQSCTTLPTLSLPSGVPVFHLHLGCTLEPCT